MIRRSWKVRDDPFHSVPVSIARILTELRHLPHGLFLSSLFLSVFCDMLELSWVCGSAGISFGLQLSILNLFSSAEMNWGCVTASSFFCLSRWIFNPRNWSASIVRIWISFFRWLMICWRLSFLFLQANPSSTKIARIAIFSTFMAIINTRVCCNSCKTKGN